MYVCLWSPAWSTDGESAAEGPTEHPTGGPAGGPTEDPGTEPRTLPDIAPLLVGLAPRIRVEREVLWADGRGLDARGLATRFVERLAELGVAARAGVAGVPVAAELAARWGAPTRNGNVPTPFLVKERTGWGWRRTPTPTPTSLGGSGAAEGRSPGVGGGADGTPTSGGVGAGKSPGAGVVAVPEGGERAWLAGLPVSVLGPPDRLRTLLDGVGVHTLGALAGLEREAVEVRLGAPAVDLWRLARADDRRLLFDRIPPERPHGYLEFVDYVLTDPSRLLFTANALLGPLCDGMVGRGEHARTLRLTLPLANGETWTRTIRPARPTASRETWLRLIREILDRLTVPDAVAGMGLEVGATEEAAVRQGDLFDRGFATATAVEAAIARLAERQLHPLIPETNGHPLLERRGEWVSASSISQSGGGGEGRFPQSGGGAEGVTPGLGLQMLEQPRRITVETAGRRDHHVPLRLRDRKGWREVVVAAGPDRISGGQWEASSYAREYYRCVTEEGVPLWIYRDGLDGGWYLQGWWD